MLFNVKKVGYKFVKDNTSKAVKFVANFIKYPIYCINNKQLMCSRIFQPFTCDDTGEC